MSTVDAKPIRVTRTSPRKSLREHFRAGWRNVFGLDLRSLAVFRIALGLLLISDLIFRAGNLVEMYTSEGFYTREVSFDYYRTVFGPGWESVLWSLHWLSDSPRFQAAMFILAALFALLLVVGRWTRFATLVSWILLVSLHVRNPVILSSGDFLLKMMLFWSVFIPLGGVWSLDARRRRVLGGPAPDARTRIVSTATAGFVIQLFAMYFFTGLSKWNEGWWSGEAMYHALGLQIYATDFGRQLLEYPLLLKFASVGTVFAEVFLILTLFSTRHNDGFRVVNLIVFWALHIGIVLSMSIGLFPWICMVAWLPLIPSGPWNWLARQNSERPIAAVDANRQFRIGPIQQAFCGVMICFILLWNVSNIEWAPFKPLQSRLIASIGYLMRVDQHFQMFGDPPKTTPWFVYDAVLDDGSEVDLLTGAAVNIDEPGSIRDLMPSFHWRKLHRNLVNDQRECLRLPLAKYMADKWDRTHEHKVSLLRMIYFEEDTGQNRADRNRHSKVWAVVRKDDIGPGSLFEHLKSGQGPAF